MPCNKKLLKGSQKSWCSLWQRLLVPFRYSHIFCLCGDNIGGTWYLCVLWRFLDPIHNGKMPSWVTQTCTRVQQLQLKLSIMAICCSQKLFSSIGQVLLDWWWDDRGGIFTWKILVRESLSTKNYHLWSRNIWQNLALVFGVHLFLLKILSNLSKLSSEILHFFYFHSQSARAWEIPVAVFSS